MTFKEFWWSQPAGFRNQYRPNYDDLAFVWKMGKLEGQKEEIDLRIEKLQAEIKEIGG